MVAQHVLGGDRLGFQDDPAKFVQVTDWKAEAAPYYDLKQRMFGVQSIAVSLGDCLDLERPDPLRRCGALFTHDRQDCTIVVIMRSG